MEKPDFSGQDKPNSTGIKKVMLLFGFCPPALLFFSYL